MLYLGFGGAIGKAGNSNKAEFTIDNNIKFIPEILRISKYSDGVRSSGGSRSGREDWL